MAPSASRPAPSQHRARPLGHGQSRTLGGSLSHRRCSRSQANRPGARQVAHKCRSRPGSEAAARVGPGSAYSGVCAPASSSASDTLRRIRVTRPIGAHRLISLRSMVRESTLSFRHSLMRSVEVIGRYSNPPHTPVDLQRLLSTACLESPNPTSERPPRQHQRRLRPDELSQLKSEYLSGVEVKQLAQRFEITRQTVMECMRREGVRRRYPKLGQEEIDRAASLYRSGWSLVAVGEALSVDPSTVRRVLLTQGVPMRDPQGRERRA
jgi:hypothetical protein